jgi:phage shock protein PspC (stress-responsive transcriptional regulator)
MEKKLKRSNNVLIAGVCAGLAEYLEVDATVVRIGWALLTLFSAIFLGIIAYIICAILMPKA